VELTEAETEYAVNVVKHVFDRHVVFQYNCTNTIPEQLLEHVRTNIYTSNFINNPNPGLACNYISLYRLS
jgi:coatomer protein complex subunit gamma